MGGMTGSRTVASGREKKFPLHHFGLALKSPDTGLGRKR